METAHILYTHPGSTNGYKGLIAAQYSGVAVRVDEEFDFCSAYKEEKYLKKFPDGKMPALETNDGQYLSESNAIAYFLANEELRGGECPFAQAKVQQWMSFADTQVEKVVQNWVFPLRGINPAGNMHYAREDGFRVLNLLNNHFSRNTYLVNGRITLADIAVFCSLTHIYQLVLDPKARIKLEYLDRWLFTMLKQSEVQAVIPEFEFCQVERTRLPPQPPCTRCIRDNQDDYYEFVIDEDNYYEFNLEVEDEAELEPEPEPEPEQAINPFDLLPKGNFNLDDFKRCFLNEYETVAISYFWEKFDAENYSIWFGEYKYNDKLTRNYMSFDLITNMLQRLDKMRKHSFASVCLFGEDNNSSISGIWVFRGQELAFSLSSAWQKDYNCYAWRKLDATSEETKELVAQYFAWNGTDKEGRNLNKGKIFK